MQEVMCAPNQLQDQPKSQGDEMEEINIACEGQPPKPLFINNSLLQEQKFSLVRLLKEYYNVFAWFGNYFDSKESKIGKVLVKKREGRKGLSKV